MFNTLKTDFYQLSMFAAYVMNGQANDTVGFEAFVRTVKGEINPHGTCYYFKGSQEVVDFIAKVRQEICRPEFIGELLRLLDPKLSESVKETIRKEVQYLQTDFEVIVYPDDGVVKPFVPVFQYRGPKWIGQLIETPILSIINGRTGLNTFKKFNNNEFPELDILVNPSKLFNFDRYQIDYYLRYRDLIAQRASSYRSVVPENKLLLEAAFRRAPSMDLSVDITRIALEYGWNGTSNCYAFTELGLENYQLGGTMAHSYVMSHCSEIKAFKSWNNVFPKGTYLIDTYDSVNALKTLIDLDIQPDTVRIDSEPLEVLAKEVRKELDKAGWKDTKIFLSGDLTPERIYHFNKFNIPYDKVMAGTKFCNIDLAKFVNAGFVYKLVQVEKYGELYFPEKKSQNKSNYSGLKRVYRDRDKKLTVWCMSGSDFGLFDINTIKPEDEPIFIQ